MSNISEKTTAFLLDELISTNLKCWHAQESVMSETDPVKVAKAAKDAQLLNARRNQLIRALDVKFGESAMSVTDKTYDKS